MTQIEVTGEVTIEVDDIEGLEDAIEEAVSEAVNTDEFKKFIKNAVSSEVDTTANIIGDETERILGHLVRDEVSKQLKDSKGKSPKYTNRELATDDTPNFDGGLIAMRNLSGKDGKLVVDMVNYLKENSISTLRHILDDISYYFQYCIASGINTDDANRIREHFRVQAKQELDSETDETSN